MELHYDDIIVGAGSCGSVLAARLSEDTNRKVLLLEAGPDFPDLASLPAPLQSPFAPVMEGYNWPLRAYMREPETVSQLTSAGQLFAAADGKGRLGMAKAVLTSGLKGQSALTQFPYPVGRVTGGSSATNGTIAMLGEAEDYQQWATAGNPAWNSTELAPLLAELTQRPGFFGELPIEATHQHSLTAAQQAFSHSCTQLGYMSATGTAIHTPQQHYIDHTVHNKVRMSTALCYLAPARARTNLTIRANTCVIQIVWDQNRAIGLDVATEGQSERVTGKRIILAAGAIHSPTLLMRSGVGPATALENLGISSVVHLSGVGQHLSDHASVGMWAVPAEGLCQANEHHHQVALAYASPSSKVKDLHLFMSSSIDTNHFPELKAVLGSPFGLSITTVLGKPYSQGHLALTSRDWRSAPDIYLNCATDPRDMERLMEAVRLAWQIYQQPTMREINKRLFAWNDRVIASDKLLQDSIKTFVRGSWHPTGSARMGPDSDPDSVVSQYGKVHGTEALYVVDASIMPTIPSVPTNLSCVLLAEKLARQLSSTD